MSNSPLRFGDIEFLNIWPVTFGLRHGHVSHDLGSIEWISGTPAQLNQKMVQGDLDVGVVSSFAFLQNAHVIQNVPGWCVRAEEEVASVVLVSRKPLEALAEDVTVGVSNQGATTPVLLKILLKARGVSWPQEVTPLRYPDILDAYEAALLIGDEALDAVAKDHEQLFVWDLGKAWAEWTQHPMIFALWVARRSWQEENPAQFEALQTALQASYAWGQAHPEVWLDAMQQKFGWSDSFLRSYFDKLTYHFDEHAQQALQRFAEEAVGVGALTQFQSELVQAARPA